MGKNIRISVPSVRPKFAPLTHQIEEDRYPCILTMGDLPPQACPFRSLAHKQTEE